MYVHISIRIETYFVGYNPLRNNFLEVLQKEFTQIPTHATAFI